MDLDRTPVEYIWPGVMGIFLAEKACRAPFMKSFGVDKGNGISTFIDIPHALSELVKEYFKIPMTERQVCSTVMVDKNGKEVEEVYDDDPSVGNGVYKTTDVVENHLQKINKSDVDKYLNETDNTAVEEDTVNEKTQESYKGVKYDTSIGNGVHGSAACNQFKGLLTFDSLDDVNVCALKLMELLSLGKLNKGATASS